MGGLTPAGADGARWVGIAVLRCGASPLRAQTVQHLDQLRPLLVRERHLLRLAQERLRRRTATHGLMHSRGDLPRQREQVLGRALQHVADRHNGIRRWGRQASVFDLADIGEIETGPRGQRALAQPGGPAAGAEGGTKFLIHTGDSPPLTKSIAYVELLVNSITTEGLPQYCDSANP